MFIDFIQKSKFLISIIIGISATLIPLSRIAQGADLGLSLKGLALSAAIVSLLGATARLWAHDDKGLKDLDQFGKILGFWAAYLAIWAGGFLLALDIVEI